MSFMVVAATMLGLTAGIGLATTGSLIVPIVIHIEFNLMGLVMAKLKKLLSPEEIVLET